MHDMTSTRCICLLIPMLLSLSACNEQPKASIAAEKVKILQLHHAQRDYHFNKDSIAFAQQLSDDFISVNKGKITSPKRAATIARYNGYFSAVTFLKWDDVTEPIIKFSDDASMAYTIVDKIVVVNYENESGEIVEGKTHFAWTAIYKKYGEEWKIDCVSSTERLDVSGSVEE